MHIESHESIEALEALAQQQISPAVRKRFRAVLLARSGLTAEAVALELNCTCRAVQKWLARYNAGGPAALADRPGRGRKPKLDPSLYERVRARIEAGPTPDDGVESFHGPDVRRILRDEFDVILCDQSVYNLLNRLGSKASMARLLKTDARHDKAGTTGS